MCNYWLLFFVSVVIFNDPQWPSSGAPPHTEPFLCAQRGYFLIKAFVKLKKKMFPLTRSLGLLLSLSVGIAFSIPMYCFEGISNYKDLPHCWGQDYPLWQLAMYSRC